MAAFSTAINVFSTTGDARTYELPAHTVAAPYVMLQKRKVANGTNSVAQDNLTIVKQTLDADGINLPSKSSLGVEYRRPAGTLSADIDSLLVDFRDFVNSDEFADMLKTQAFVE